VAAGANRYERRAVTLGRTSDGATEIVKGLRAGDVVVAEGALLLRAAAGG
jgi:multidrug efflux pump subunit AcrA (membrane-fusion protein)